MKIHGMPETFWLLLQPSPGAELDAIVVPSTIERLMSRVRENLIEDEIVAVYADEGEARKAAANLLGEYPVRPQDTLVAEVVVHVIVTPTAEEMSARELAKAAVEAVRNALSQGGETGFRHRLAGHVSLGTSEVVELRNMLTMIG